MSRRSSPNERRLRIVLVGGGMASRHHLTAWSKLPFVDIAAVCDVERARAATRAQEFSVKEVYADFIRMFSQVNADAVDVAVPPGQHAVVALAAAKEGLHILCQKPLMPTYAQAVRVVDEIGDHVRFMVHENWRFRPYYRQTKRWLEQQCIGDLRTFRLLVRSSGLLRADNDQVPYALRRQPFLASLPRLLIMELLIHHLDVSRFLFGDLRVIASWISRSSDAVAGEDTACINLTSEDGVRGSVSGSFVARGAPPLPADEMVIDGDAGRIQFKEGILTLQGKRSMQVHYDDAVAYQQAYDAAIGHFAEAIRTGDPFETDRLDNLRTLRLVEDAYSRAEQIELANDPRGAN